MEIDVLKKASQEISDKSKLLRTLESCRKDSECQWIAQSEQQLFQPTEKKTSDVKILTGFNLIIQMFLIKF